VPWLPGLAKPRFLRLVECVVPRSVALAFALRRQRSHVRIVSGAPFFSLFYSAISTAGLKLQLCLIRASKQICWKIVAERR
jgi:hypothetical protein